MSIVSHRDAWLDQVVEEEDEHEHSSTPEEGVKRRKFNQEHESGSSEMVSFCPHANNMKAAGFSLSAIEEMKSRADEDTYNETLDQQLRQFQVLDEVGSNSEDDDGKSNDTNILSFI